jgi:flagellar protein FlbD
MIHVTRLNGIKFLVNANLIEQVESTPDTVITLTTGNNIIVRESVEDVRERIIQYHGAVAAAAREKSPV